MPHIDTHIAGPQFRKGGKARLEELAGRFEHEDKVRAFNLEREPTNKYDSNAVRILDPEWDDPSAANGFIGFVPKDWSFEVARVMDSGGTATCFYRGKHLVRIQLSEKAEALVDNTAQSG